MTSVLGKRQHDNLFTDKIHKKLKTSETQYKKTSKKSNAKEEEDEYAEYTMPAQTSTEQTEAQGKGKKVYLKSDQLEQRVKELQQRIEELAGPENANKRKRVIQRLVQLKKASSNPELLVDPEEELARVAEDKQRRIQKKIDKARRQKKANSKTQRHKHDYCILCKTQGHVADDCREGKANPNFVQELNKHICFNCGKTDHSLKDCQEERKQFLSFATCFFCKEKGHLSRDCPQNEQGIYHKGGSCFECGSVRHLAKECPIRLGMANTEITNENNLYKNNNNNNNTKTNNKKKVQSHEDDEDYAQPDENDIFSDEDE